MKILAVDYGDARTGLAMCDRTEFLASPIGIIEEKSMPKVAEKIVYAAREYEAGMIVLGLPLNMDGSEGPRCQSTRAFARNLERLTDLPITFWDERLSTVAAERVLLEADTSRKRRSEVIDHVAAGYILQGALDRIGHLRRQT